MTAPSIRRRREGDLAALTAVLSAQQPHSHYPYVWPQPRPLVDFIRRAGELAAWTAVAAGQPVGHVSVTEVGPQDPAGPLWADTAGVPVDRLVCVAALFLDRESWDSGLGTALLGAATGWARSHGRTACLDVVPEHTRALAFYRRKGWREAGTLQPAWLAPQDGPQLLLVEPPAA